MDTLATVKQLSLAAFYFHVFVLMDILMVIFSVQAAELDYARTIYLMSLGIFAVIYFNEIIFLSNIVKINGLQK